MDKKELEKSKQVQSEIIKLLEKENCTIRQARYILQQVSSYIVSEGTVQFRGMPMDYEF